MITRTPIRNFLLTAVLLALCIAGTQTQLARAQAVTDPMPVDPQITMGKFANGMSYYIRANKKPEKRAELRLVVKAGSILEDDDQQGLAHLVEHMAFNGTKHVPKNEIISFLESIGKPEIIQKGKAERLKQFYSDWYRPDLMAVVAVGDFDKAAVEKMLTNHFASIPAATKPRPRQEFDVPGHAETAFAIATDKEANTTSVEIDTLLPSREEKTVGDYRQQTVDRLF